MPDSPKCPECLKNGLISQTYKVAGKPYFKCHKDGKIYLKAIFTEEDYLWRENVQSWKRKNRVPEGAKITNGARFKMLGVSKVPTKRGDKAVR